MRGSFDVSLARLTLLAMLAAGYEVKTGLTSSDGWTELHITVPAQLVRRHAGHARFYIYLQARGGGDQDVAVLPEDVLQEEPSAAVGVLFCQALGTHATAFNHTTTAEWCMSGLDELLQLVRNWSRSRENPATNAAVASIVLLQRVSGKKGLYARLELTGNAGGEKAVVWSNAEEVRPVVKGVGAGSDTVAA